MQKPSLLKINSLKKCAKFSISIILQYKFSQHQSKIGQITTVHDYEQIQC